MHPFLLIRILLLAPLALVAAACQQGEVPGGDPALYRIDRPGASPDAQAAGWLFGTIHALPQDTQWRRPAIDKALAESGVLIVEIADLDPAKVRDTFARLSIDTGLPPLEQRVSPEYRDELAELLDETGVNARQFRHVESWAAAISLSALMQGKSGMDAGEGVDRALIADYAPRPVSGLETVEGQFAIFDRLDSAAQQDLLESLLENEDQDPSEMTGAWLAGDTDALAGLMDLGLGDGESELSLRKDLLTDRNRRWIGPIVAAMERGDRPFVAVGAGHVGGSDGLIALFEDEGWTVTRVR